MFTFAADIIIAVLVPFLALSAIALTAMLAFLVLQRGTDQLQFRRRQRLTARYRPLMDGLLAPDTTDQCLVALARVPARHRFVLETMILKTLALATGSVVAHLRDGARAAGLVEDWARRLPSRKWWVRAESARALGLVRESRALPLILSVLDDDHEEVRAAAVESLGLIGHPDAIPVLLARLSDESRHQRARIVEALRGFGDVATPALVAHARTHASDAVMIADILGLLGGQAAAEVLKRWVRDPNQYVRTAAMRALGTIGLDEEGAGLAVTALSDEAAEVRAMGARALGRSRRSDAAPRLAAHLDDEWIVAASCADALRRLGRPGVDALQSRVDDPGYVGDLARQMLWERGTATAAVGGGTVGTGATARAGAGTTTEAGAA